MLKTDKTLLKTDKTLLKTENTLPRTDKTLLKTENTLPRTDKTMLKTENTMLKTDKTLLKTENTIPKTDKTQRVSLPEPNVSRSAAHRRILVRHKQKNFSDNTHDHLERVRRRQRRIWPVNCISCLTVPRPTVRS
jgi:hypothetical protein